MSGDIDDFFTKGDTFSKCEENIHKTMRLYDKLGYVINLKKSQIVPTQKIRILGFVIDSVKMIITLTEEKKQKLKTLVLNLLRIKKPTIRYLAKVIGTIISCMPAAILGPLFCRYLENDKVISLRLNKGNILTHTQDRWCLEYEKKALHINCKELLAVYYSLRSFKSYFQNKHVKIFSDSHDIVKNIWLSCVKNKIWITAAHIPGAENVIADYQSRTSYKDAEWMLNPEIFQKTIKHLKFKPDLDCFASRLNTQLPKYISYKPDPYAYLIGAFSVHWGFYKRYLFPPFS